MDPAGSQIPSSVLASNAFFKGLSQKFQFYLDKTAPHVTARWVGLFTFILLYAIRVYMLQVCHISAISHALAVLDCLLSLEQIAQCYSTEAKVRALKSINASLRNHNDKICILFAFSFLEHDQDHLETAFTVQGLNLHYACVALQIGRSGYSAASCI